MDVKSFFVEYFGYVPQIMAKSPGRINLIGEHTDYNLGFVLPAAIDKAAYVAIARREDQLIRLFAKDLGEEYQVDINLLPTIPGHWSAYILGVVDQLRKLGTQP